MVKLLNGNQGARVRENDRAHTSSVPHDGADAYENGRARTSNVLPVDVYENGHVHTNNVLQDADVRVCGRVRKYNVLLVSWEFLQYLFEYMNKRSYINLNIFSFACQSFLWSLTELHFRDKIIRRTCGLNGIEAKDLGQHGLKEFRRW